MNKKCSTSQLQKHLNLLVSVPKHFVSLAIKTRLNLIRLYPAIENLINLVFKRCVIIYLLSYKHQKIRESLFSMQEFHLKNKLMILIDKLNSSEASNLNTAHMYLLQIFLQELILQEKGLLPYWKPVYNEMSMKLLLPIKTDCVGLDLNLSTSLLPNQEEKSQSLMITRTNLQNKNCQKTCYQLSTSTVVNKWVKEAIKEEKLQKSLKIKIKLTPKQKQIINNWIHTSNYVYNKTIEYINNGYAPNFYNLRDLLVTKNTKKNNEEYKIQQQKILELKEKRKIMTDYTTIDKEIAYNKKLLREITKTLDSNKNDLIQEWEYDTPKDIRAGAVNDVCKAFKTAFSNLKANNISHFKINYRKHYNVNKSIVIPKTMINVENNSFKIAPSYLKEDCKFKANFKKHHNLSIEGDCRLLKQNNEYWIILPVSITKKKKEMPTTFCGVDPGIRTFMTAFTNDCCYEYTHNKVLLDKLNKSIFYLKSLRTNQCHNKRKALNKREKKKANMIDEVHWKTINHLLSINDVILYGDIKSHDIVKDGKNKTLNRNSNDLKFYLFKQRLFYKASIASKLVYAVNEAYTSKCCSSCGRINNPGVSKIYTCTKCNMTCDRDINASKNILLKGIITNL